MKEEASPSHEEEVKEENTQTPELDEQSEEPETPKEELHWTKPATPIEEETRPSRHIGRWILILLLTLVIGFGAAYFTLAFPAEQELRQVKTELAATQEKLSNAESTLESMTADLEKSKSEIDSAQYALALAKVQVNVAYARASLLSRDLLTARQEVSAAATNLKTLLPYIEDKEIRDALSDRMDGIEKAISTDSAKALDELRTLSENLLRLEEQP